ncbi:hypothetical protein BC938DRAFT_470644 [Jimgerdemannia flammicorona]|uniref:Uncharacterized protein n=1 Tax=Jimgerdemannia flammicorona TaxID=994334 RepID=A0A433Q9S0_9FUNG|nr:hypothetical protein BC938DRAFT_470644 [Jimgerdemannia flammicorona]
MAPFFNCNFQFAFLNTLSKSSSRHIYDLTGPSSGRGGAGTAAFAKYGAGDFSAMDGDETLQAVLYQLFLEFMDGDFETIRTFIRTLTCFADYVQALCNLAVEKHINSVTLPTKLSTRLRLPSGSCGRCFYVRMLLTCIIFIASHNWYERGQLTPLSRTRQQIHPSATHKYFKLVRFELMRLYEHQHQLRQLSYFDILGRLRLTMIIARVLMEIPIMINVASKGEDDKAAAAAATKDTKDNKEGRDGTGFSSGGIFGERVEKVLRMVVGLLEKGEKLATTPTRGALGGEGDSDTDGSGEL